MNCPSQRVSPKCNLENYLGYKSNSREEKEITNRRNGYFDKTIKTSIILPKHKRDVSDIENKVPAMYARGMSQRNISATIDDIYGFKLRAEQISIFVDYPFVPIKRDYKDFTAT